MATQPIKTRFELDGEKEYKAAVSEINASLRVLNSEMKLVSEQFKNNDKSVEALTASSDVLSRHYFLAYLQALWRENVSLFPISISQQGDTGTTIGIVFNSFYNCRYLILFTFEVDDTVAPFVSATDIAHSPATLVVATTGFVDISKQGFFRLCCRDFLERAGTSKALTRRSGFEFL